MGTIKTTVDVTTDELISNNFEGVRNLIEHLAVTGTQHEDKTLTNVRYAPIAADPETHLITFSVVADIA